MPRPLDGNTLETNACLEKGRVPSLGPGEYHYSGGGSLPPPQASQAGEFPQPKCHSFQHGALSACSRQAHPSNTPTSNINSPSVNFSSLLSGSTAVNIHLLIHLLHFL